MRWNPWSISRAQDRKSTRLNSSHGYISYTLFFFNDPAPPEIYALSLHDALPILKTLAWWITGSVSLLSDALESLVNLAGARSEEHTSELQSRLHLVYPLFF